MLTWYFGFSSTYLCSNIIKVQVDFQIPNHISKFEMQDLNILFCLYISPSLFFPKQLLSKTFAMKGENHKWPTSIYLSHSLSADSFIRCYSTAFLLSFYKRKLV